MCPSWQFSSITEAKRHVSLLLHTNYKKESLPGSDQIFQYKFEKCDMIFPTYYKLSKHRNDENHFVRNKRSSETSTSSKQQIAAKRKKTSDKISEDEQIQGKRFIEKPSKIFLNHQRKEMTKIWW